jgi:SAM-dependent methyltransferase
VFGQIHDTKSWRGSSVSGTGSDPDATAPLLEALPALLANIGVRTILDAPCGDGNWMAKLDYPLERYTGIDVVPAVVSLAAATHGSAAREYRVGDLIRDPLPQADLVLCRDCLVHLPLAEGVEALANIRRSGATWLLATTFPARATNADIRMGRWRPLNLCLPPFSLPEPAQLVSERFAGDPRFADKALGLWRLS